MEPSSEQELVASTRLRRLNRLRKVHARATRSSWLTSWSGALVVALVVFLVPSEMGVSAVVAATVIAAPVAASLFALNRRVDAVVEMLEASGAFALNAPDKNEQGNKEHDPGHGKQGIIRSRAEMRE